MNAFSRLIFNGTSVSFTEPEQTVIEGYVIEGAGYFLKSHSEAHLMFNKIELSDLNGTKHAELQQLVACALANMENAKVKYTSLTQIADTALYEPSVLDLLSGFDYYSFQQAKGLNGIILPGDQWPHLFAYMGVLVLLSVFFFALGTIAGTFKSRFAGFVTLISLWFVFVFLVPWVTNAVIAHKADNIASTYQLELEKLKLLMGFEKQAKEKEGPVTDSNTETERALVESAWNNELKAIQALEKQLANEMQMNIRRFEKLSCFFPSTFYLSAGNEISGKGYENFMRFFERILKLKWKFIRFYIDKRYYSDYSKVEPFIKDSENLFYSETLLPRGFLDGVLFVLVYILVLFALSYVRFKRSVRI